MRQKKSAFGLVILIIFIMMPLLVVAEEPAKLEPLPFTIQAKDKRDAVIEKIQQPIASPAINENVFTSVNSELLELKNSIEQIKQEQAKQNDIVGLKDQLAEMKGKAGDNKQAFYDSQVNFLSVCVGVLGIILVVFGAWGFGDIKKLINEKLKEEAAKSEDKANKRIDDGLKDIDEMLRKDFSHLLDYLDIMQKEHDKSKANQEVSTQVAPILKSKAPDEEL